MHVCVQNARFHLGTELCTVVEAMYSYEVLYSVTGDTIFGKYCQ